MEFAYLGIVIFLFLLAIVDLMVGVGNDAVNFLSSAVGARVSSLKTILIVAAIGVFLGAASSNGMMDIARHGIFLPEHFYFDEIMVILLAVVVSDVVLLDLFNTLGLPTSTTVSMVFELLGASFVLAIIKLNGNCAGYSYSDLINTDKALSVIMAIFCSVAIAFVFGALVQWLSRLLFSFSYRRNLGAKIGIFGGIAATSIVYFMLFKVVLKASFMTPEAKEWINDMQGWLVLACFIGFAVLMQILYWCKVNVFKVIVLLGTFALAMAFAGNDLVNFIGVTLTGQAAFEDYVANSNGLPVNEFLMTSLNESAKTPIIYLFGAGAIMVLTLVTSKKARKVLKTTVDLSRQDEGDEMFGSSYIARTMVRSSVAVSSVLVKLVPAKVGHWIDSRFNKDEITQEEGAAFDMVRASVNLVLASLLIAVGSSLKLPLSTTYVAFMVAMGSSLADRAWGRETAVYRVTGVISVIGGWFVTAGAALFIAGVVALVMYYGGLVAMAVMVLIASALLIKSNFSSKKISESQSENLDLRSTILNSEDSEEIWAKLQLHTQHTITSSLEFASSNYLQMFEAFCQEDGKQLRRLQHALKDQKVEFAKGNRIEIRGMIRIARDVAYEKNTWFHLCSTCQEQMFNTLSRICDPMREHVENTFYPMTEEYEQEFDEYAHSISRYLFDMSVAVSRHDSALAERVSADAKELKKQLSQLRKKHLERLQHMQNNAPTMKVNFMYLNLIQESHELLSETRNILRGCQNFFIDNESKPKQQPELDTPAMFA